MDFYPQIYFKPNRDLLSKPGSQLVSCLHGHKTFINSVDMTADGKLVATSRLYFD